MKAGRPAGVILAGGRSSRMGVTHKALLDLNGRTLLAHVVDRVQPHLYPLMLSCESKTSEFETCGLPLVPDLLPGFRGPLTGLYSTLQHLADTGQDKPLVVCPCDAPFTPDGLVPALLDVARGGGKPVAVVSYRGVLQPTFSLWQVQHLPVIRDALLNRGIGGLKHVMTLLPLAVVEWAITEPSPFFNVNTPEDLETAARWLDRKPL